MLSHYFTVFAGHCSCKKLIYEVFDMLSDFTKLRDWGNK